MADIDFSDATFQQDVLQSKVPVVVDFWAVWCAPCRIVSPVIDELAKDYQGKVKVGKMDVDANPNVASQFGIMSIPTVMVFKNGQVTASIVGARGKEDYKQAVEQALTS